MEIGVLPKTIYICDSDSVRPLCRKGYSLVSRRRLCKPVYYLMAIRRYYDKIIDYVFKLLAGLRFYEFDVERVGRANSCLVPFHHHPKRALIANRFQYRPRFALDLCKDGWR